jgi:hypothetical protein
MRVTEPEIPPRAKRCENCAAFDPGDLPRKPGTCRVLLPVLVIGPTQMGGQGISGQWVPTTKDDWCLHHKPIEN